LVEEADVVFHLAAQVAVTTSLSNPREDFGINAFGTFQVLEAVRRSSSQPIVVYSSTNKVYGKMPDLEVAEDASRYTYAGAVCGISEGRPLDFYSPYGCSKGTGDQYTVDYARIYGLRTVVFRQSCIYGPHQFGMEDQGWVAWFAIRALQDLPVTIYGDGKQVRDLLYVDDLTAAYDAAIRNIEVTTGQAYNVGGGPANTLSILELIALLERRLQRRLQHSFDSWRPGDQRIFVSDIRKAEAAFGWQPRVSVAEGAERLLDWLESNRGLFVGAVERAHAYA
jgi:CDP-paratose 2-epimerase